MSFEPQIFKLSNTKTIREEGYVEFLAPQFVIRHNFSFNNCIDNSFFLFFFFFFFEKVLSNSNELKHDEVLNHEIWHFKFFSNGAFIIGILAPCCRIVTNEDGVTIMLKDSSLFIYLNGHYSSCEINAT